MFSNNLNYHCKKDDQNILTMNGCFLDWNLLKKENLLIIIEQKILTILLPIVCHMSASKHSSCPILWNLLMRIRYSDTTPGQCFVCNHF